MTWFRCIEQNGGGGGGESKKGVPAIASTSAQWIALPFYDDDNPIIKFKMLQTNNVYQSIILGDLWDISAFCLYMESDDNNYFRYNTNYEHTYAIPKKLWKWVDVEIDYSTGKVTFDGTDYTTQNPKTQLHNQIYLFGLPGSHMANIAISEFKVYVNNTLTMDLEPRRDINTGAGYFYDLVGGQDYYSASSTPLKYYENYLDEPSMELIYSSGTAGTETFTVRDSGTYLIMNGWSWQGSAGIQKGETTLPSGVTAAIDEEIINTSTFGYRLTVADLQVGDVITMTNYDASWIANTKLVFKVENIPMSSVIHQTTAGDGWIDVSSITGSGKALFIGACESKFDNPTYLIDESIMNLETDYDFVLAGHVDTHFLVRIVYCPIADMPRFLMYGTDGGFAGLAVVQ